MKERKIHQLVFIVSPKGDFFMFTGIITHLGTFVKRTPEGFVFAIPLKLMKQISEGTSIAINGVCLTVNKAKNNTIYADVMPETLKATVLGNLQPNTLVNLELPVTMNTFLSGHIVQGHVDGVGIIKEIKNKKNSKILLVKHPARLSKFIVEKGSVAVNGISLTIVQTKKDSFTVAITPYTFRATMLHAVKIGSFVNLEVDILAKYTRKLLKGKGHEKN